MQIYVLMICWNLSGLADAHFQYYVITFSILCYYHVITTISSLFHTSRPLSHCVLSLRVFTCPFSRTPPPDGNTTIKRVRCRIPSTVRGVRAARRTARLCSAPVISWLASSREAATQVCPIKPSPVLKRPEVFAREAAFMTQNRGDELGSPPEPSGSVYSV